MKTYRYLTILFVLFAAACGDDVDSNGAEGVFDSGLPDATADAGSDDSGTTADGGETEDAGERLPPRPWSVLESGPYNVGWTSYEITYDAYESPDRTVRMAAWYPTLAEDGDLARYDNFFNRLDAPVFAQAEPALDGPLPVLVFSHGNSGLAEQSYYMTEFFASHGWLVIAPDHTGNTWTDNQGSINLSSALVRPQDVSAALDDIYARPADDLLHGLAGDDVVLSGHSFGGFTTLANAGADFAIDDILNECDAGTLDQSLCEVFTPSQIERARMGFFDERIDVAIPQTPAGALVFRENLANIPIPTLLMTAERDLTLPNEEEGDPIWDFMDDESVRVDLVNAGHFTYSNMCDFFPIDDGCGPNFIAPEDARPAINAFALAFSRWHLWGEEADRAIATGAENPFPDHAVVSTKSN
jgi:predicted dienelactone hydrolase